MYLWIFFIIIQKRIRGSRQWICFAGAFTGNMKEMIYNGGGYLKIK
jgi:hypothetical protein